MRAEILSGGYDGAAVALFARMSVQPPPQRKQLTSRLIRDLKSCGAWDKFDLLYVPAAHDAQAARLNWKADAYNLSLVSAPTFTADRGYAGDGAASYLSTGWAPSAGVQYTQNGGHIGVYVNATGSNIAGTALINAGATDGTPGASVIAWRASDGGGGRVNGGAAQTVGSGIATRLGHSVMRRIDASTVSFSRNGVQAGATNASTASTRPTTSVYLGCNNASGTAASFVTDRHAILHAGANLSDAELFAVYNAFSLYLTAIGAQ